MIAAVEQRLSALVSEIGYAKADALFAQLKGGKRLRAKLVMMIAADHPDAITLAAVIEMIHAASLLHDDVIDEAQLRRGVPSVNATEGSKQAVMLGDILYSKAFSALTGLGTQIAKKVADAVTGLSVGEMMDVEMAKTVNTDAERYLEMLYLKTGILIEAAAETAAMLCGEKVEAHALYGKNLGIAFQIIDDILDIVSDEATLGKPAMSDYREGKCTLPYIYLFERLNVEEAARLRALHGVEADADSLRWIREKMEEHGVIEASYAVARRLSDEALAAIAGQTKLEAVIESMMQGTF